MKFVLLPFQVVKLPLSVFQFSQIRSNHQKRLFHHIFRRLRIIFKMLNFKTVPEDIFLPPDHVKGMKTLDKEAFQKTISIPYFKIPVEKIGSTFKILKPILLKINRLEPVFEEDNGRTVLLNPLILKENPKIILEYLEKNNLNNLSWREITLSYENYSPSDLIKAILPVGMDGVTGFSMIGHIIHLNLKEHYKDYKYIIGQILLDKHTKIKTVVNKVNTIENTYRSFQMEVLAGEPNFEVEVKENKYRFAFDFSKVFWNSRLGHEHAEICSKLAEGDIVFDVFAGVGPFAIPAAGKKCTVFANDLNPDSYKWLAHNAKLNKVSDRVSAYNMDGNDFIRNVVKEELTKLYAKCGSVHIIMNLPACAFEFLVSFTDLLPSSFLNTSSKFSMPIVYCYFFVKQDEDKNTVIKKHLNSECINHIQELVNVRLVAPNKEMYRLVFTLPFSVLVNDTDLPGQNCMEPELKKIKVS